MSQPPVLFTAVSDRVHLAAVPFDAADGPAEVSVGLVVGDDAVLLIDTGATPAQGRSLREAAAAVTDVPLSTVVLTHWHYDHSFGLSGVDAGTAIAHESVRARLVGSEATDEADRLGLAGSDRALPNRDIAVVAALDLGGGVRVEIVHLGRGHTDGDLVVVLPGADLVFAGDLVESSGPPSYGPDTFPHEWPATLDGLIGLTTERTRVIPGHGAPMDRQAVFEQRSRVAAVAGEIARLAGLGVSLEDAEGRGEWALPFGAIRGGYEVGCVQVRGTGPGRSLPLV